MFRYSPWLFFVFFVAIAISRRRSSSFGCKTTPCRASVGLFLSRFTVSIGCFRASRSENRDVSLTSDGLPMRAST
uniref:Putative secreted peptide n=1 Tax=Anopheles braziliensis TaxID=58242 RepID=A0A2M3ZRJ7_9DIPT